MIIFTNQFLIGFYVLEFRR